MQNDGDGGGDTGGWGAATYSEMGALRNYKSLQKEE